MYYTHYMRARRSSDREPQNAERVPFAHSGTEAGELAKLGILRRERALEQVNEWNRLAAEFGSQWFYYLPVNP